METILLLRPFLIALQGSELQTLFYVLHKQKSLQLMI
jgi:hypothetical protein